MLDVRRASNLVVLKNRKFFLRDFEAKKDKRIEWNFIKYFFVTFSIVIFQIFYKLSKVFNY